MKLYNLATRMAAPVLMLAWTLPVHAQAAAAPTVCQDGTTSTATGRGACSSHGGVQKTASAATAPPASAAKSAPAAPAATAPAAAKSPPAAATAAATSGNTDPTGATAKCKDGTYSKSQHRSGTCSGHGGVADWLTAAH